MDTTNQELFHLITNIIHNLQPTKETKIQNLGYIAKLNADKSQILNVYLDRKTAAENNGYSSPGALDNTVKNGTNTNGFYYVLYEKCDINLINDFETEKGVPLLYKNGIGQYDSNNNLVKEFTCKYDCIRQLKISDKTLNKILDTSAYNGFQFKSLGRKLYI